MGPAPGKGALALPGSLQPKNPLCELSGGSAPPEVSLSVGDGVLDPRSSLGSGNSGEAVPGFQQLARG